jgi:short chain dehydrogenase
MMTHLPERLILLVIAVSVRVIPKRKGFRNALFGWKGELPRMVAQGSGAIVNCSSIGGIVGSPGRTAYSASKHAISGPTRFSSSVESPDHMDTLGAICRPAYGSLVDCRIPGKVPNRLCADIIARHCGSSLNWFSRSGEEAGTRTARIF